MGSPIRTIALTIGDPNGIGPEIAVKAALTIAGNESPRVILVGDDNVIRYYADRHAAGAELVRSVDICSKNAIAWHSVNSLPSEQFKPGQVAAAAGKATVDYMVAAVKLVRSGVADAIIGCPHNETAVNAAGIKFTGYPGLIARLTGTGEDDVFMMLVGGGLRILHVTLHERLHDALARLTPELVERAGMICAATLERLGISNPKIGVFGINPHAGENGLFGDDDDRITVPAVKNMRARGLLVEGPIGADVILSRKDIDGFVAMYHDQGHIPVKLLAGRTASAFSLGSSIFFSSVGHGSAFDIAGQGKADATAVLRTIARISGSAPVGELTTHS
jgi:4-hydroxy-L-threonine phosphate dehydrogenase PdxA